MCKLKDKLGFYNLSLSSKIRVNGFKTTPQFKML